MVMVSVMLLRAAAAATVLGRLLLLVTILVLVFQLATHESSGKGANDTVTRFVSKESSASTTRQGAH